MQRSPATIPLVTVPHNGLQVAGDAALRQLEQGLVAQVEIELEASERELRVALQELHTTTVQLHTTTVWLASARSVLTLPCRNS